MKMSNPMKTVFFSVLCVITVTSFAQEMIPLTKTDDSAIRWENPEKEFFSQT